MSLPTSNYLHKRNTLLNAYELNEKPPVVTSHAERDESKQSRCSRYPCLNINHIIGSICRQRGRKKHSKIVITIRPRYDPDQKLWFQDTS